MAHRVVVTGLGLVTPVGVTVEDTWAGLLAGRSGVAEHVPSSQPASVAV